MLNYYTCSDVATKFLCNINITAELTVEHAHALLLLAPRPCLSERIRIWRQIRLVFIQSGRSEMLKEMLNQQFRPTAKCCGRTKKDKQSS